MTEGGHILLVDDEEDIVTFMENFLRRFKITSTKALSGEAAIALYGQRKYDLVFLDIRLKGIDGFVVLKEFKSKDPSARVIMITGAADKASQDRARELGAIDYISKPLDLGELKGKLDRYILGNPAPGPS